MVPDHEEVVGADPFRLAGDAEARCRRTRVLLLEELHALDIAVACHCVGHDVAAHHGHGVPLFPASLASGSGSTHPGHTGHRAMHGPALASGEFGGEHVDHLLHEVDGGAEAHVRHRGVVDRAVVRNPEVPHEGGSIDRVVVAGAGYGG